MIGLAVGVVFILLTHVVVAVIDSAMADDERMGSWGELYIICFFIELLWDFVLVHIFTIIIRGKASKPGGNKVRAKLPEFFFKGIPMQPDAP